MIIPHSKESISNSGYYPSKAEQLLMASKAGSRSQLQREPKNSFIAPRIPPSYYQGQQVTASTNPLNTPLPKTQYYSSRGPSINFTPSESIKQAQKDEKERLDVNTFLAKNTIDRESRHDPNYSNKPTVR
jgi:hypothetical protein